MILSKGEKNLNFVVLFLKLRGDFERLSEHERHQATIAPCSAIHNALYAIGRIGRAMQESIEVNRARDHTHG